MIHQKINHIAIKLVMNDSNGVRQLDFLKPYAITVPKSSNQLDNTQLENESFDWGVGQKTFLCKLFITNQGSEDISYKVNPRDGDDYNASMPLAANKSRELDFLTINCIEKLNVRVNGPGVTTILVEGYAFNINS